jgi:hypothetical protein
VHVPTRSGYRELGLELVSLEENCSRTPKKPSMEGENKDNGTRDPFKMLLEEALERQRNEMMDNFAQILRRLSTSDTSTSSGGTTPFKVQINFDIPIFEGQIDVDVVDKWLNLLEGYFLSTTFPIEKRLHLRSSRSSPMSKIGGRLSVRKRKQRDLHYL